MRFKGSADFVEAVAFATRVTGKSVNPETEYIQIEGTSGEVTVKTLGAISSVTVTVPVEPDGEPTGSFVVNADRFWKIIKGAEKPVTITLGDPSFIVIDIGPSRWTMPTIDGKLVTVQQFEDDYDSLFAGQAFISGIVKAKSVVSTDPTRWAYQQVAVRDGFLLASDGVQYLKYQLDAGTPDMTLPSSCIADLAALSSIAYVGKIAYKKIASEHVFKAGNVYYSVLESNYDFPVSDQVFQSAKIAAVVSNTLHAHANDLRTGLEAAGKILPKAVYISTDDEALFIEASGEDYSTSMVEVPAYGVKVAAHAKVPFEPLFKFMSKTSEYFGVSFGTSDKDKPAPLRLATTTNSIQYVLFQVAD